ncbi:MAG: hypothetical protein WB797_18535 [Nocardioides sp.]
MSEGVHTFRPTNGRIIGVSGLLICMVVAAMFAVSGSAHIAVPGILGSAFGALLVWSALLRPGVSASADELHIRTLVESVSIPLAAIDTVVVRRYLLVRAGGKKYICPAISRPLRKTVRAELKWKGSPQLLAPGLQLSDSLGSLETQVPEGGRDIAYPDFVETQISTLADSARARRGIAARSEEEYELGSQVVRRKAWPEIVGLAVLGAALVVALLVV